MENDHWYLVTFLSTTKKCCQYSYFRFNILGFLTKMEPKTPRSIWEVNILSKDTRSWIETWKYALACSNNFLCLKFLDFGKQAHAFKNSFLCLKHIGWDWFSLVYFAAFLLVTYFMYWYHDRAPVDSAHIFVNYYNFETQSNLSYFVWDQGT